MHRLTALSLVCCLAAAPAWGERVQAVDKPIIVRLEVNKPTSVEFPEPLVDVAALKRPDLYSTNATGPYLYIFPYQDLEGRLFVVGQSGKQYMVSYKIASPADDILRLTQPLPQTAKPQPFAVSSWLRSLRTGTAVPGQQPVEMPAPTPADGRLALLSSTTVSQGALVGMTLAVRNMTAQPVLLDVRVGEPVGTPTEQIIHLGAWVWPPRYTVKAVATDSESLEPGMMGHVYVVLERRGA